VVQFTKKEYSAKEWEQIIVEFTDINLMQCWEYGEAKAHSGQWQIERGIFEKDGRLIGAAQVFVRPLPLGLPGGLAWVNRGPLWHQGVLDKNAELKLALSMLAVLRRHYVEKAGLYLRIASSIPEEFSGEGDLMNSGIKPTGVSGWASAKLDLTSSIEEIRAGLRANWRGHLNKAERSGIEVKSGDDRRLFQTFVENHQELLKERGFKTSMTPELLNALQDSFQEDRKMRVYLGYMNNALVASLLMVRYGDTCEYLAGNLAPAGRKFGTGQLLLWQALVDMKYFGCKLLDVSGMDPVSTPKGIYDFKSGLNPEFYRLSNELEGVGKNLLSRLVQKYVQHIRTVN